MTNMIQETKSVGGVVFKQDGLVLMVNQDGASCSLPKGHIEEGESEIEAAQREIHEESGIDDIELVKKLGSYQRYKIGNDGGEDTSELKTIFMYLFTTNQTVINPIDPNIPEAKRDEKEKVAELLTHPKDQDFFRAVLDKL